MRADFDHFQEFQMSDDTQNSVDSDGRADAFAATAIIGIIVLGLYIWLSGMPS